MVPLVRRVAAELIGTLLLSCIVVGSGIAASRLSPTDVGLQLLENAAATALGLFVLITVLAPISGAHLNPLVTIADVILQHRPWREVAPYVIAQIAGAITGSVLADVMFDIPPVTISGHDRLSLGTLIGETIATAGLVGAIFVLARTGRSIWTPAAVATWIGSAYLFTSSTSFANPAITIGRIFSNTFAGIAPTTAAAFIAAQVLGAALGAALARAAVPISATGVQREQKAIT